MPSISHHWVRLTDQHLSLIIDGPPDQEEENDEAYLVRLLRWSERVADLVEEGLETW
jgi:hypothetical protein